MGSLSIRKLSKELEGALLREAREKGRTKSEIVTRALESAFFLGAKTKMKERLRKFFGKMDTNEFESFQNATKVFSEIEPTLWK